MEDTGNAEPRVVRATLHAGIDTNARRGVPVDDPRVRIRVYLADLIIPDTDGNDIVVLSAKTSRQTRRWPSPGTIVVLIDPFEEPGKKGRRARRWCLEVDYGRVLAQEGRKL
jgi:hypothetical protein